MCAVFGYLDYRGKLSDKIKQKLIQALSVSAEIRGTDATGISYVKNQSIVTFKKAAPAHQVDLFFPRNTKVVIGHTRMTTQGSEKKNYNNHPFRGTCGKTSFSLAHNGVLYNDKELREQCHLPGTKIETDSYVAVQILEQEQQLNTENLKRMAELVDGSFVFTVLREDDTLFLIKGSNPLAIRHYPQLGLYLYASTEGILEHAVQLAGFHKQWEPISITDGEILQINSNGLCSKENFLVKKRLENRNSWSVLSELWDEEEEMLFYYSCFGVEKEDIRFLRSCGYLWDEIEEMLMQPELLEETLQDQITYTSINE